MRHFTVMGDLVGEHTDFERFSGHPRSPQLETSPEFERARGSAVQFVMVLLPLGVFTALILVDADPDFKLFMVCVFFGVLFAFAALLLPMRGAKRGLARVSTSVLCDSSHPLH